MEVNWIYSIIILSGLIILSAFFSGSEVALFSLNKRILKDLKEDETLPARNIVHLLEYPRRLLITILIGNTIVNVLASIVAVTMAIQIANAYNWSIDITLIAQIIILTMLVLLFGEIFPKVWANKNPLLFSKIVSIPLYWISILIYPVTKIIYELMKITTSKLSYDKSKTALKSSEITELAELGVEKGSLEEDEHELIHGLVSFKTVTAREVMTPRVDIAAISVTATYDELTKTITETGHSRIPLYENDIDNIVGIIYAKDLLKIIGKENLQKEISLRTLARETIFVPETKLISALMREFQSKNLHVGIVVDEYGGTSGLISLEDVLEEIVGEIRDEYDVEEAEITQLDDNNYMLLGKLDIHELNELLDMEFSPDDDDYDTLGGFIFNQAGNIPEEGYSFETKGFLFTVKEVLNRRINKVLVTKLVNEESEENE